MVSKNLKTEGSLERISMIDSVHKLIGTDGILSPYIKGYDSVIPKISDRLTTDDGSIFVELSVSSHMRLPAEGIQDGIVYECRIEGEKEPRFRFRLGKNRKLHKIKPSKNIQYIDEHIDEHIEIDQVAQVGSKGAFYRPKSIIITMPDKQTIGTREQIIDNVKGLASKITKK